MPSDLARVFISIGPNLCDSLDNFYPKIDNWHHRHILHLWQSNRSQQVSINA